MTKGRAALLGIAALAACASPGPEVDAQTQARCRTEARMRAAGLPSRQPAGMPAASALVSEQEFYRQCIAAPLP
jgi:hypothetical protein